MSFLANAEIGGNASYLFPEGHDPDCVKEASYDLRLGSEVYVVGELAPKKLTEDEPYVVLGPGQFAILTTHEKVQLPPNLLGLIALKNQFKMQGLVNISGFHVDPTFKGRLLFAVQNVAPADIRLKFKSPTFIIFFSQLTSWNIGKGRDKQDVTFKQDLEGIRLQDVQLLGGSSITLSGLQKEVHNLRTLVLIYGPFVVAAFLALLINLFK